jgi:large subunit ribosomal protein L34
MLAGTGLKTKQKLGVSRPSGGGPAGRTIQVHRLTPPSSLVFSALSQNAGFCLRPHCFARRQGQEENKHSPMKRQYQPSKVRRRRQHGFLARNSSKSGRAILRNRRRVGRKRLTPVL